jgi:hypothetical protein
MVQAFHGILARFVGWLFGFKLAWFVGLFGFRLPSRYKAITEWAKVRRQIIDITFYLTLGVTSVTIVFHQLPPFRLKQLFYALSDLLESNAFQFMRIK